MTLFERVMQMKKDFIVSFIDYAKVFERSTTQRTAM